MSCKTHYALCCSATNGGYDTDARDGFQNRYPHSREGGTPFIDMGGSAPNGVGLLASYTQTRR